MFSGKNAVFFAKVSEFGAASGCRGRWHHSGGPGTTADELMMLPPPLFAAAAAAVTAAVARPHVSAGFGCSMAYNITEIFDYRWDALDSVHYHDAVTFVENGSTVHSTHPACDFPHGPQFTALRAQAWATGVQLWLSTGNSGFGSFGPRSSDQIMRFLTDDTTRWRAINTSLDAVELGGLYGLSLDVEGDWRFNQSVREPHSRFVKDLAAAGRLRTPPIPVRYPIFWDIYKDAAVDLVAVANVTEATTLMTYDYHWCIRMRVSELSLGRRLKPPHCLPPASSPPSVCFCIVRHWKFTHRDVVV
eukprot:SAG11_NODE_3154_length_2644_cov_3.422004_2_plen_303_part_00